MTVPVRVGGYGAEGGNSIVEEEGEDEGRISGVLVVGGDTLGSRKQPAEFVDTTTLR